MKNVQQEFELAPQRINRNGEKATAAYSRTQMQELSKLILDPILPHLKGKKNLIISPDGALWMVPWSALPMSGNRYLIEDYVTGYVVSGRELFEEDGVRSASTGLIMADPDYDAGFEGTQPSRPRKDNAARGAIRQHWNRLFGTQKELNAILPLVSRYLKGEPKVLTKQDATESALTTQSRSPRTSGPSFLGSIDRCAEMVASVSLDWLSRVVGLGGSFSQIIRCISA